MRVVFVFTVFDYVCIKKTFITLHVDIFKLNVNGTLTLLFREVITNRT